MEPLAPNTPLDEVPYAVVDVETTGLGAADRVIEVACVRLRGLQEVTRFQSLVNPGIPIAASAAAVSGISDAMVNGAPIYPEVAPAFEPLLAGAVFVAHNAPFDLSFLSRERRRWQLPPWQGAVLDTLRLARNVLALPSYALGDLKGALDLEHAPSHRALADVLATASLLGKLIERMDPRPRDLQDLLLAQEPIATTWEACLQLGLPAAPLEALAAAARSDRAVELEYQSRSGVATHWVRSPAPERNGPLFYVRAVLIENDEERTFRVDRIVGARIAGEPQAGPVDGARDGEGDPA